MNDTLPHDLEAEMSALGAAMQSPTAAALVVESLTRGHFHRPSHQVVFEAIVSLVDQSITVNPLSVKAELERHKDGGALVDPLTLMDMVEIVPVVSDIGFNLRRLENQRLRRDLILSGARLAALGHQGDIDAEDLAEEARKIFDRVTGTTEKSTASTLSELISPFLDRLESEAPDIGVTTGWKDLDGLVTKLRPGQLVVLGARPGMGKSVFMVNMALHVAVRLGQPVLFASLEMSKDELLTRIVAHEAKVTLQNLQQRTLSDDDWRRVAKKTAELTAVDHLIIDDNSGTSIAHLRARLSSMRRTGEPAAIVFVDYLQLMSSGRRSESRQQEVSDLSRNLKLLAKDMDVPIVVGSQLNRDCEKRTDKRPLKSDLRESGSLEQDADIVVLLHRDDAYDRESPRAGEIDLIVDKHRQGATATITAAFQGHYSRIADMAGDGWSPSRGMS
ncbi:replicative DNA helicase [Planomonospora sp. ID67723]|uniref:replicative DNA helicase n=1 Tax=Planomonospora sp. ID67723 TaxID=2738134 RepID=UPI0018C446D7|nr:replicative DNA helicase [Planomonospora sp. ID67723]MBG0828518.1 replicative DNA helicase [Planomonospora sp. ID67723]